MSFKKIIATMLSICLVLTAGCGMVDSIADGIEEGLHSIQGTVDMLSNGGFEPIDRGTTSFSDMEYVHYDEENFLALCREVEAFADADADLSSAREKVAELYKELCYVYTMGTLAGLIYDNDPAAPGAAEELSYSQELYYRLSDEYMYVIGAVAASPNANVLEEDFYVDTIEYLAETYGERPVDYPTEDAELYSRETELVQEYYLLMSEEWPDEDKAVEIFIELVELRQEEAAFYGYDSYADYVYYEYYYKDYTPMDARELWAGVKEHFVPIMSENHSRMYELADKISLRSHLDSSPEAILDALDRNLPAVSDKLHEAFRYMVDNELYDISRSDTKVETGYTTRLYYYDVPYLFNCPYGDFYDYLDTIHEFGHFANCFYTWSDLVFGYPDNDLSELQSQGLEIIFTAFYEDIFGQWAEEVEEYVLLDMLTSVVDGAMYDEFLQRVYAEDELNVGKVKAMYAEIYEDYGYGPYEGYEYEWIYVPHNFEFPFYYISYAVSALSALELHSLMQRDYDAAVEKYLNVSAMDTEAYYFSEALEEAGFSDVFDPEMYAVLAEDILRELD